MASTSTAMPIESTTIGTLPGLLQTYGFGRSPTTIISIIIMVFICVALIVFTVLAILFCRRQRKRREQQALLDTEFGGGDQPQAQAQPPQPQPSSPSLRTVASIPSNVSRSSNNAVGSGSGSVIQTPTPGTSAHSKMTLDS